MIYFLSYYHCYAGLCNQLYLITNHLHETLIKGNKIFIHKFNVDIFNKKRVPIKEVLDLVKTNENIKNLTGKEIIELKIPEIIEHIPKLCVYPVNSIEILNCLEFNESIVKEVNLLKSIFPNGYNSIHFRLDIDAIIHYIIGKFIMVYI